MAQGLTGLVRFWTRLDAPVDRRTYLIHGLSLAAVKYAGDVALVWLASGGQVWTPSDYLNSVYGLLSTRFAGAPSWLLPALGLWALPFLWLGVTLTFRRALDAGRSCFWAFAFFVPYVNYALMGAFAVLPTASPAARQADLSRHDDRMIGPAILSITAGVVLGLVATSIVFLRVYSGSLFLGLPFAMGALTAFLFNRRYPASSRQTQVVTLLMVLSVAGAALLLATEGLLCILMAAPLGVLTAASGALLGRQIVLSGDRRLPPALFSLLMLPLSITLEPATAGRIAHEVRTAVDIDASPERVWRHVIAFRPIAEPSDLLFRLGIVHPQYARLDGEGVGAVRYCVFSTGTFVEPITRWEVGRRLSFDVVSMPAPLRELTPYEDVTPPHLDGYLRSTRGEFRLVPLQDGGTRLEGSTWYELEMAPEGYWQLFADYLIHRIHRRVLDHIKHEAEM